MNDVGAVIDFVRIVGTQLSVMQIEYLIGENSPSSAGVYAPWRGGNLNDGANCGLPCANGNNGPGTANWNGVPRHADDKIALKRA